MGKIQDHLRDEIQHRSTAMAATGDVPEAEWEEVALDDIVNTTIDQIGAYTRQEKRHWWDLRRAASNRLVQIRAKRTKE